MTKDTKMTITRALVQLKLLDKRIVKATQVPFITYQVGSKIKDNGIDPSGSLKSVENLIKRREVIKALIMDANAKTLVNIGNESMTIAAAIEKKKTIVYLEELRDSLSRQFAYAQLQVDRANEEMQERLDRLLEANAGKDLKTRDAEIETITQAYKVSNEASLVDTIKIQEKIAELDESIDNFMSEVDLCLSEINAITYIEL